MIPPDGMPLEAEQELNQVEMMDEYCKRLYEWTQAAASTMMDCFEDVCQTYHRLWSIYTQMHHHWKETAQFYDQECNTMEIYRMAKIHGCVANTEQETRQLLLRLAIHQWFKTNNNHLLCEHDQIKHKQMMDLVKSLDKYHLRLLEDS